MSFANDIVNGNYSAKKKKKNSTMAEQIINGDYALPKKTIAPEPQKKNNNLLGGYINSVKSAFDMVNPITNITKTGNDFVNNLKKGKVDIVNQDALKGGTSKGFDWMDLILVPGSTAVDAASNFMAGVENIAYNTAVLGAEGIATIEDLKGNKNYAKQIRENIGGKNENVNEYINKQLLFKNAADRFDQSSLLGNTSDEILQGAGYYGGMVGLQQIGVPWQVTAGVTSYGGALQEAYANDATATEAHVAALMSAAGEIASEYMSSGLKLPGTGASLDKFQSKLVDKFGNKTAKAAMGFLMQIGGEGTEEVVSGLINSAAVGLTYGGDDEKSKWENLKNATGDYLKNQAVKDFAMGAAVTALTNGVNPQTYNNMKQGRNLVSGYTQDEQNTIDTIVEQRIQEAEEKGEKVKRSKIEEQVEKEFNEGNISVDKIEEILGGENYQKLIEQQNRLEDLKNQKKALDNSKLSELTAAQNDQRQELKDQIAELEKNTKNLQLSVTKDLMSKTNNSPLFQRSYYNASVLDTDTSNITNEVEKKTIENAKKAGITNKYKDRIGMWAKLAGQQDAEITFTTFDKLKKEGKLVEIEDLTDAEKTKLKNLENQLKKETNPRLKEALQNEINDLKYYVTEGYKDNVNGKDVITINLDSAKATQKILMHEFKHVLEKSKLTGDFNKFLFEYADKKGDLKRITDIVKNDYKDAYGSLTQEQIDSEVSAKLIEEYLSDDNFVKSLNTKPTFKQKLKELIDKLVSVFTPNSNEGKQLRELQKKYRELWNDATGKEAVDNGEQLSANKEEQIAPFNNVQRSITKDNQGRELSKQQQEFYKDAKTVDENGNLKVYYHGSPNTFNTFDITKAKPGLYGRGFYFANDTGISDLYEKGGKTYEVYINSTNPLQTNTKNITKEQLVNFLDAVAQNEDYSIENYGTYDTQEIANNMFDKSDFQMLQDVSSTAIGDMVEAVKLFNEVNGTNYDGIQASDQFIAFEPNQIKETTNKNPTDNPDIRYSISKDNQGRNLTEGQQEYFKDSKVRDSEGNLLTMYHGTASDFTIFDKNKIGNNTNNEGFFGKGFYFTNLKRLADDYSNYKPGNNHVMEEYLNITNPFNWNSIKTEEQMNQFIVDNNLYEEGVPLLEWNPYQQEIHTIQYDWKSRALTERLKEAGYDGVIYEYRQQDENHKPVQEVVVFESNQIKNVDNTNPTNNEDIRYSISKQGKLQENGQDVTLETSDTGTTGSLMAIHNLGEGKLNGILDLGGFPVPSIAITNPSKINHNQFGEISVLFDKSTIDPANRLNEVYDRDVWTPTFPTIEYDLNTKVIDRARKAVGGYGNSYLSNANSFLNNIEDKVNRQGLENVIEDLKDNKDFKYVYYKSLNPNFELLTKQDSQDLSTDYSNAMLEEFANEYGEVPQWSEATSEQRNEIVNRFLEKLIPQLEERANKIIAEEQAKEKPRMFIIGMAQSTVDNIKEKSGALGWQDTLLQNLNKIQNEGTTRTVNDYEATSNFIEENIDQKQYEKWINELFNGLVAKKGIYNGKEYLTSSGNRRSFNQLHEDYNLQNLVKILTAQETVAGEQGFGAGSGFGTIQAQMNNQFESIEDIRNAENRIVENAGEITNQYRELIGNDMEQLGEYLKYKSEYSYLYDSAGTALNDFAGYKNLNMTNLNKALENNNIDSKKVPLELKQKIIDDISSLKDLPTDYFEAKPQRAVGLDEIQQVVLPNTTTQETKQRLQDMGIEYTEYDPTIEGDRNRVINQFDNLKWSLNRENIAPTSEWVNGYQLRGYETPTTYEDIAPVNRTLDPLEISQLTPEDANTTPELPTRRYRTGSGQSSFFENATETTKMLPEEARDLMRTEENIKYYNEVTNEESMNRALTRLNEGGAAETLRWFKADSKAADATDVAEGWILMKQYSDNGDYSSMVEVAKKMRDIGTNAGQTVQAFNIMSRLTPEGMVKYAQSELSEAYDQMVKNKTQKWIDENRDKFELTPDEVEFIMTTMEKVKDMEDGYEKKVELAKIQKIMTDKLPPAKGQGIKGWMRISMLFNPKTQVRNVVGNALIMPVNSFGDLFASVADYAVARKTGVRTTGLTKVKALAKGGVEGFKQATNDFKLGINTKNMEGNRFEIGEGKSFRERTIIGKSLNRTEAMLNYVMDAGDRVFSQAAYENSIANQLKLNNTDTVTPEMIDIAIEESLSRTWNDNNNYTRFVLNVRKGLNAINVRGYGLGDVLIPFAKTPANLTKAIVDYSPVGLVNTIVQGYNLRNNLQTETWTAQQQHQFVQTLGKASAGSMLYILAYALAKAGIATGKSDDDKDTRDFLKNTLGISGYSIKIGDKSFTYDWAQPIAAPLAIMTNIENGKDAQGILEAVISSTDNASSVLMEQSFLQSINDVLNSQGSFTENLMDEILELPTRAVPTFVKQINDMVDGTQRQTFVKGKPLESAVNKFKAKIPVLSQDLAPTVDTMGREVQKYGGKNNFFNVFLNPANVNTENISEEAAEIYRVYQQTGDKTIMPRVAPYYIDSKGERKILTTQERAEFQKEAGEIIENGIKDFMNSSEYVVLSEEDKAKVIKNLIDYAYNKARKDVVGLPMSNTYNRVNKYLDNGGSVGDYYLNKDTIDDTYKWLDKNEDAKVALATVTTGDVFSYHKIYNDINTIKANTKQDKQEVLTYVQNLDLDVIQKAIIFKQYYSSFHTYDREIIQYVATSDLDLEQKYALLESMKFKVNKQTGTVSW
jgi:hypothetical protein